MASIKAQDLNLSKLAVQRLQPPASSRWIVFDKTHHAYWISVTLLLASVGASPVAEPATTAAAAFCSVVTAVVTKGKAQVPATAYCSSFLGIKTSTIRKTVPLTRYALAWTLMAKSLDADCPC